MTAHDFQEGDQVTWSAKTTVHGFPISIQLNGVVISTDYSDACSPEARVEFALNNPSENLVTNIKMDRLQPFAQMMQPFPLPQSEEVWQSLMEGLQKLQFDGGVIVPSGHAFNLRRNNIPAKDWKLCYVTDTYAWFTTQELSKQWGDGWDRVPYEHNATEPDAWDPEDGGKEYEFYQVAWQGPLFTPCHDHFNSPWSVRAINQGETPWLKSSVKVGISIFAGESLQEFIQKVHLANGKVYLPLEPDQFTPERIEVAHARQA